jgi:post-segregation antitoxin (ccd killing protein)
MTLAKRKVSISLDEDLVEELEREGHALSTQVNAAVRAEIEHRRRQRLLVELLDQLDAKHGPVEESLVEKYLTVDTEDLGRLAASYGNVTVMGLP